MSFKQIAEIFDFVQVAYAVTHKRLPYNASIEAFFIFVKCNIM